MQPAWEYLVAIDFSALRYRAKPVVSFRVECAVMDLLAGYGSGPDDDEGNPVVSPRNHAPEPIAAAQPSGLFSRLPAPKHPISPGPTAPRSVESSLAAAGSLPADFFDSAVADDQPAATASSPGQPAEFLDSTLTAAARVSAAPDTMRAEPIMGPAVWPAAVASAAAASDDIPLPTDSQLWGKLPTARRRKVLFRPHINMGLLAKSDSDEDDAPAAKRPKQAATAAAANAGKPSILSFLPAPKHQPAPGKGMSSMRLQTGGIEQAAAAAGGSSSSRPQQQQQQASPVAAAAAGNEAYRLVKHPAPAAAAAPLTAADTYAVGRSGAYEQYYQHYQKHQYEQHSHYASEAAAAAGYGGISNTTAVASGGAALAGTANTDYRSPEEALLQEALQAEAAKAARRAMGAGSSQLLLPNIQFKEVNAADIKYVDPAQREAAQGMRAALGPDYAAKLRAEAAPHKGSRLARSKHQIGTLFANAKLQELEMMERKAGGMKTKAESAAKYGW